MKLDKLTQGGQPLVEDLEYSPEFAEMILNESLNGNAVEVDPDELLMELQGYLDDIARQEAGGGNG